MPTIKLKMVRVKDADGIWHDLPAVVSEESFRAAERAAAAEATAVSSAESAASSASEAASSAESAAGSATTAATKAGEAASSAESAVGSASTATAEAESAAASASDASGYASTASSAASTATTKAGLASDKADAAYASADAAAGSASTAVDKAGEASDSATAAAGSAAASEAWAAGTSGGTPSETNNAAYYATQAGTSATDAASSAASAEAWATGGSSGTPSETNNAEYWAGQAETAAESVSASAAQIATNASDITDLKDATDDLSRSLVPISWSPALNRGNVINSETGITQSNSRYTRLNSLFIGYPSLVAIDLDSVVYEYSILYYTASGDITNGTGYLGSSGYNKGLQFIPNNAEKICINFHRIDDASMASSDNTAILSALSVRRSTDRSLSMQNYPADAKVVGDNITEFHSILSLESPISIQFKIDGDGRIDPSTGSKESTSIGMQITNYVDISMYSKINYKRICVTASSTTTGIAFYDENKTYISGIPALTSQSERGYADATAYVPDNARYVRFTLQPDSYGDFTLSGVSKIKTMPNNYHTECDLERGTFYIDSGTTGNGYNPNSPYRRTDKMIEVGEASVSIVFDDEDVSSISAYGIYEYGIQNGAVVFLQRFIPPAFTNPYSYTPGTGTKYIKIGLTCSSGNEHHVFGRLSVYSSYPVKTVMNPNLYHTDEKVILLLYQVSGDIYTAGQLRLPPNYSVDGDPVPLHVYFHGTGGMEKWNTMMTKLGSIDLQTEFDYWANEGFATFDCYPWTSKYYSADRQISPVLVAPNERAYIEGIKYVCSHYNVSIDNVCCSGLSLGGQMAYWFSQQTEIPIRAIAMMAPSSGWISQRWDDYFLEENLRAAVINVLGLGNETGASDFIHTNNGLRNNTVNQFVLNHLDSFAGMNPASLMSVGASYKDRFDWNYVTAELVTELPQWMEDLNLPEIPEDYMTSGTGVSIGLSRIVNHPELTKFSLYPMKFWQAFDDTNVSGHVNYTIFTWLKNGGSEVYWRTLASGHGGHGATGYGPLAERTNVTTRLGIAMEDVAVAQKEMIDFFYDQIVG